MQSPLPKGFGLVPNFKAQWLYVWVHGSTSAPGHSRLSFFVNSGRRCVHGMAAPMFWVPGAPSFGLTQMLPKHGWMASIQLGAGAPSIPVVCVSLCVNGASFLMQTTGGLQQPNGTWCPDAAGGGADLPGKRWRQRRRRRGRYVDVCVWRDSFRWIESLVQYDGPQP